MLILRENPELKKNSVQMEFPSIGAKLILVKNSRSPISKGYTVVDLTNSR